MCVFSSKAAAPAATPALPVEYAAQRAPTKDASAAAANNAKDKLKSAAPTMLTGNEGVGAVDATGKKMLLGA
ncbi:hypothetical protein G3A56_09135 [Rhizobium oryzihabitans]|uniref:Uncharacterized protein n=1 Tax=Rhizobium oryzihabitans TaxID=2267833 RepID=A0A7L5BHC3_9HYPH|nr:hypothetical protein [Rhizobium oryzihabitans]QIB38133.1 hypothetical protein G3A56_09135 [Rhizobium oryzihabitans]